MTEDLIERAAKRLRFGRIPSLEDDETWSNLKNGTKEYWRNFVREVAHVIAEELDNG